MKASPPATSLVDLPRAPNPRAVDVLVSAYQQDPDFAQAFWAGQEIPAGALRLMFEAAHARQIATVPPLALVAGGEPVAVAHYWLPAARASLNPARHLAGWWASYVAHRHLPGEVSRRLTWYSLEVMRLLPYQPRCEVTVLGVARAEQGRGHARTLLDAVRERSRADRLSTGVAITTFSESNVRRYERLGFRVTGHSSQGSTHAWGLFAEH